MAEPDDDLRLRVNRLKQRLDRMSAAELLALRDQTDALLSRQRLNAAAVDAVMPAARKNSRR